MRAMVGLVVVALLPAIVGCGSAPRTQRTAVAAYLKHVNAVEKQLNAPLVAVSQAGRQFAAEQRAGSQSAGGFLIRAHRRALRQALEQIESLGRRLAALSAPPAALRLRALLLRLINQQASLTHQAEQLVDFLPGFGRALRPLVPASRQLERVLGVNSAYGPSAVQSVYAQKAAALRTFQAMLEGVLAQLRRLHPPPVSKPSYQAQFDALEGMSTSAGKLATALTSGNPTSIPQLLTAFDRAATAPQTINSQRAQIAAVKAYNRQSARLRVLAAAADRERLRLANTLS